MDLKATENEDNASKFDEFDTDDELSFLELEKSEKIVPVMNKQMEVEGEIDELRDIILDLQDLKPEQSAKRGYKRKNGKKGESSKPARKRMCHPKQSQVDEKAWETFDYGHGTFDYGHGDYQVLMLKDIAITNPKNKGIGKKSKLANSSQPQIASTSSLTSVKAVLGGKRSCPKKIATGLEIEASVPTKETLTEGWRIDRTGNVPEMPLTLKRESTDNGVTSNVEKIKPIKSSENDGDVIFDKIVTRGHQMLTGENKIWGIIDLTNTNTLVQENSNDGGVVVKKTEAFDTQDEYRVKTEPTLNNKVVVTPTLNNKVVVTPTLDNKVVVTPTLDNKVVVTPTLDNKVVVTPTLDNKVVVTPTLDNKVVVTPTLDNKVVVTPTLDNKVVVTPTLDNKVVVTPTLDNKVVVTPTADNKGVVTPTLDNKVVVTPTADNKGVVTPTADNELNDSFICADLDDADTLYFGSDSEDDVVVIDVIDAKASSFINEKFKISLDIMLKHFVSLKLSDVEINIRLLQIHKFLSASPIKCRQLMSVFSKDNTNKYSSESVCNGRLIIAIRVGNKQFFGNGPGKGYATNSACRNALSSLFGIDIDDNLRLLNRHWLPTVETMMKYVQSYGVKSSLAAIQNHPAGLFIPLTNVRSIAGEIVSNASKVVETLTKSRASKEQLISAVSRVILQGASCFVPKWNSDEAPQLTGTPDNSQGVAALMPLKNEPIEPQIPQPSTSWF